MTTGYFDIVRFIQSLDLVRRERGLTWHMVYHQTGVSALAFTKKRLFNRDMSVHTMATLALWSGLDLGQFVRQHEEGGTQP